MPSYFTREPFSKRQAGRGVAVDGPALSPQARLQYLGATDMAGLLVTNSTQYWSFPVVQSSSDGGTSAGLRVVGMSVVFPSVVPACSGGTSTIQLDAVASDGSTTTNIVAATDLLTGFTTKIANKMTLAATNPATVPVGSYLVVSVITNNNAVGAAGLGGGFLIGVEQVEDTIINDTAMTQIN